MASPGEVEVPKWFLWLNPPGRKVVQFHANLWDSHCGVNGQRLSDPAAVGVNHHQTKRLHTEQRGGITLESNCSIITSRPDR